MTIFMDLETQHTAQEIGGWAHIEAMRMSVACTYDSRTGYQDWWEAQAAYLVLELRRAERIVGFNVTGFDYRVLSLYADTSGLADKTFDLHEEIRAQTGKRYSLNHLAVVNLGEAKIFESGIEAVRLWKTCRLDELVAYCRRDVELTRRLYELWETRGILWVNGHEYVVWPGR